MEKFDYTCLSCDDRIEEDNRFVSPGIWLDLIVQQNIDSKVLAIKTPWNIVHVQLAHIYILLLKYVPPPPKLKKKKKKKKKKEKRIINEPKIRKRNLT